MACFGMTDKRRYFLLIPLLVVACGLIGGIYSLNAQVASAVGGHDDISASVKDFTGLYSTVEQNFADPLSADKAIYNGAIPGMLRTLDPHSNFFDPKAWQAMREEQAGHYYGIGMQVLGRVLDGEMRIIVVDCVRRFAGL